MDLWGDRLASVLRHRKVSQRSMAANLGVTPQAVGKWVKSGEIDHYLLRDLAKRLDVNWVWLRYGDEALAESWEVVGVADRIAIAKRRILVEALETEHRYRAICGILNIGNWEIDFLAGRNYWSPATRFILGVTPDIEASQSLFRSLILPTDVPGVDRSIRQAMRSTAIFWQRFRTIKRPTKWLYSVGRPVRGSSGSVDKILGLVSEEVLFDHNQLSVVTSTFEIPSDGKSLEFGT